MELPRLQRFAWRWLFAGTILLAAGHLGIWRALRPRLHELADADEPVTALAISLLAPLAVYFVGGMLVGRLSRGHTVREPALAALLALLLVFAANLAAGMINLFELLLGAPLFFGAAHLGGRAGERWQRAARAARDQFIPRSDSSLSSSSASSSSSSAASSSGKEGS